MRLLAAVLLALSTVLVGFAHRPLQIEARGYGADVSGYLLPDGSLPALCHWDDVVGHHPMGGDRVAGHCDACLLTAAPGLGAVAEIVVSPPIERPLGRVVAAESEIRTVGVGEVRARGPPIAA